MATVKRQTLDNSYDGYVLPTPNTPEHVAKSLRAQLEGNTLFVYPTGRKTKILDKGLKAGAYTGGAATVAFCFTTIFGYAPFVEVIASAATTFTLAVSRFLLILQTTESYQSQGVTMSSIRWPERLRAVVKHNLEIANADMNVLHTYDTYLVHLNSVREALYQLPSYLSMGGESLSLEQQDQRDALVVEGLRTKAKLVRLHTLAEDAAYTVITNSSQFTPSPISDVIPSQKELEELTLKKELANGLLSK